MVCGWVFVLYCFAFSFMEQMCACEVSLSKGSLISSWTLVIKLGTTHLFKKTNNKPLFPKEFGKSARERVGNGRNVFFRSCENRSPTILSSTQLFRTISFSVSDFSMFLVTQELGCCFYTSSRQVITFYS